MGITRARKDKLVAEYMGRKYPKITPFQSEWMKSHTGKWLTVTRENGTEVARCSCCGEVVEIGKTKHKGKVICPNCKKEVEVLHGWRTSKYWDDVQFVIVPKAIDSKTLMLRYYYVLRGNFERIHAPAIGECARMIINTKRKSAHPFEKAYKKWEYTRRSFFTEFNMYNYRRWCCLQGIDYERLFVRELRKLDVFKYWTPKMIKELRTRRYYTHDVIRVMAARADLYEKMYKAGLVDAVKSDIEATEYSEIKYNAKEKSLTAMLGITKGQLKHLRCVKHHLNVLEYMQNERCVTDSELISVIDKSGVRYRDAKWIFEENLNAKKMLSYIARHGINIWEYRRYKENLITLGYRLDDAYLYPRDFRHDDLRVADEMTEKRNHDLEEKNVERNILISGISKGLRENKELMEFFSGSEGLVVYVPETIEELKEEGKRLHNCLGSYADRVAEGKTLIFFIRRMEDPTAPYIAMEYCHGRVIQCRLDYNEPVKDTKIIDFAEALARKLAAMDILAA